MKEDKKNHENNETSKEEKSHKPLSDTQIFDAVKQKIKKKQSCEMEFLTKKSERVFVKITCKDPETETRKDGTVWMRIK